MHIYLLRHGESLGNMNRKFLGHTDIDLSPLGYNQSETASQYITDNLKIDIIYSSDLKRAYNTALPTSQKLGLEIIKDKNFREIFAGDWENISYDILCDRYTGSYNKWLTDIGMSKCDNGESVKELQERVVSELKLIVRSNLGKNILIATHATPIRAITAYVSMTPLCEMKNLPWCSNASITDITFDNGLFKLNMYSFDDYLETNKTQLPSNV